VIGFQSTHRDIFLPAYLGISWKHIIIWVPLYHRKRNVNVKMKMDAVDASLLVLNTMSAFLIVGIGKFDLFGVDFAATLFSPAGFGLSTAWVIGYAAITTTILTNDNAELSSLGNDIKNLGSYYMIAAAATLLLPIAFIVFPDTIGSFFKSADLWGLVYVVVLTSGQAALGWML